MAVNRRHGQLRHSISGSKDTAGLVSNHMFEVLMKFGIGAIAGLVANRVSPSKMSLVLSVLLGITGALVGARIGDVFEISRFGIVFESVAALLGSIFVLIGWRQLQSP